MTKLNTPLRAEPMSRIGFCKLFDANGNKIANDVPKETAAAIVEIVGEYELLRFDLSLINNTLARIECAALDDKTRELVATMRAVAQDRLAKAALAAGGEKPI